jgi:glutamine cyclotransferase
MTMRYLILLLLIIVSVVSCQSQSRQSNFVEVLTPTVKAINAMPTSTTLQTAEPTATRLSPYQIMESATPIGIPIEADDSGPTRTREQQPVTPIQPSPTIQATTYPVEKATQIIEPTWHYRVINEFPHDSSAYTQGLVIETDLITLLEGTGRDSSLRRVDLETGTILQNYALPDTYFGEGITLLENKIYQLTWRSGVGFIYDRETFEQIGEFHYGHEGWGLTHDGTYLIVSDGSEIIRFWDPVTFQEVRRIEVKSADGPVTQLNELEYVNGEIWANVWHTDLIARISPQDGRVLGWIDLTGLLDPQMRPDPEAVLNGIAYSDESGRLFVTGKYWPKLFELGIVD